MPTLGVVLTLNTELTSLSAIPLRWMVKEMHHQKDWNIVQFRRLVLIWI